MRKIIQLAVYTLFISLQVGAEPMIIHDFNANAQSQWSYVSDQVMGGVSEGSLSFNKEDSQTFAHMTGAVSTENNGGFIQFRTDVKNIDKKLLITLNI